MLHMARVTTIGQFVRPWNWL